MVIANALTDCEAEIWRLTAALHANRCHPDYSYQVTPASHDNEETMLFVGFELNPEYDAGPGDVCWRRRKEGA